MLDVADVDGCLVARGGPAVVDGQTRLPLLAARSQKLAGGSTPPTS